MCRTIVAIIRGGNLCGAWWHRPQFVANLFSPSTSNDSSSRTPGELAEEEVEPARAEFDFGAEEGPASSGGEDEFAPGDAAELVAADVATPAGALAGKVCC